MSCRGSRESKEVKAAAGDGRDSAVPEADVGCCCLLGSRANLDFSGLRELVLRFRFFIFSVSARLLELAPLAMFLSEEPGKFSAFRKKMWKITGNLALCKINNV